MPSRWGSVGGVLVNVIIGEIISTLAETKGRRRLHNQGVIISAQIG